MAMASSPSSGAGRLAVITWPRDAAYRQELLDKAVPHLLLVDEGASPPDDPDPSEDWVRLPAPPGEIEARLAALRRRIGVRSGHAEGPPVLTEDGLLRTPHGWVALSPGEVHIVRLLLGNFGEVTSVDLLDPAAVDGKASRPFQVRVLRLRRKIAPIGLRIVTLRQLGYVFEYERQTGSGSGWDPSP